MGLIAKIFSWVTQPMKDNSTTLQWGAGLLVIIMLAFLWSTVVNTLE